MGDNRVQEIKDFYKIVIEKNIEFQNLVAGYRDLVQDEDSVNHDKIPDLILFISLFILDLTICNKYLLIHRQSGENYEMNYFSRALATHLSEALATKNSNNLLSRINEISKIHINNIDTKSLAIKLGEGRKRLLEIKNKQQQFLKGIRNNMFAHRDGKGIEQYNLVSQINEQDIALLGADIEDVLNDITKDLLGIQQVLYPVNAANN